MCLNSSPLVQHHVESQSEPSDVSFTQPRPQLGLKLRYKLKRCKIYISQTRKYAPLDISNFSDMVDRRAPGCERRNIKPNSGMSDFRKMTGYRGRSVNKLYLLCANHLCDPQRCTQRLCPESPECQILSGLAPA
jgi:hypothetical protein